MNLDWIMREIENLSPDSQSIFVRYYFHQLPLEEVARRVGRPLNTVKVYLHRARQELLAARDAKA